MRKSLGSAVVASILIVLLVLPQPANAWGSTGHQAIAYIAWQQLADVTKARVMVLLAQVPDRVVTGADGKTHFIPGYPTWLKDIPAGTTADQQNLFLFMRAATWPDTIRHEGLFDANDPAQEAPGEDPAANTGFTDTSSHGYWHFVDTGFGTARPKHSSAPAPSNPKCTFLPAPAAAIPATPTPNAATEIDLLRTALASNEADPLKAYDLIWVEHLVGDIHQPLHASVHYDKGVPDIGGNCVSIHLTTKQNKEFEGANSTATPPTELHAFWDDLPGISSNRVTDVAVAFATALPAAPAARVADTVPADAALESFKMAKKDAYSRPIKAGLGSPTPYAITDAYYSKSLKDAKLQVALAGARLAKLLNENLQ